MIEPTDLVDTSRYVPDSIKPAPIRAKIAAGSVSLFLILDALLFAFRADPSVVDRVDFFLITSPTLLGVLVALVLAWKTERPRRDAMEVSIWSVAFAWCLILLFVIGSADARSGAANVMAVVVILLPWIGLASLGATIGHWLQEGRWRLQRRLLVKRALERPR